MTEWTQRFLCPACGPVPGAAASSDGCPTCGRWLQAAIRPTDAVASLRADLAEYTQIQSVQHDAIECQAPVDQVTELMRLANDVADRIASTTIGGLFGSPAERVVLDCEHRPGSWYGDESADGRMLTQQETDTLVRLELGCVVPMAEALDDEFRGILGEPRLVELVSSPHLTGAQATGHQTRATRQRGGIDSDPLVRLLAWRAWGDRDRVWFEERGVRAGDPLSTVDYPNHTVGVAWPGEDTSTMATGDARPGEMVEARTWNGTRTYRVSDRLREPPPTEVQPRPQRAVVHADGGACHGTPLVYGRCPGCGIVPDMQSTELWLVSPTTTAHITLPRGPMSDELRDALAERARQRPLRRPDLISPAAYELLVRSEIRRALARGDSRRRVVRDIAAASTLSHDEVLALVDRELAATPSFAEAEAAAHELASKPLGQRPAAARSAPPIPPWARERRRRR